MFGVLKRCSAHQTCEVPAGQFPQGFMPQVGGRWIILSQELVAWVAGCKSVGLVWNLVCYFLTTGF